MHLCVFLVVLALGGSFVQASWDQGLRNHILKIHNDYRKAVPGACGMKMIGYDTQLENEARLWAKRCVFEHQMKTRGENIAWITKYGSQTDLVTKMSKMWYGEVKDYTYGQYGCGRACHYTQMVWSNSVKVGCYAQDCSHLRKGGNNAYFLVCFYSPQGNWEGENPYKKTCAAGNSKKTTSPAKSTNNNSNNNKNKNNNQNNNWNSNQNNNQNNNNNNGWISNQGEPDWSSFGMPDNNDGWTKKVTKTGPGSYQVTWQQRY